MASMGFSYAQIHVQQERCRMKSLKAEEKDKKAKDAAGGGDEVGNKRPTAEDDKASGGGRRLMGKREGAPLFRDSGATTAKLNGGR
ncbi:unnamed protein product [Urochloa humidicola]